MAQLLDFTQILAGANASDAERLLAQLRQFDPNASFAGNDMAGEGATPSTWGMFNYDASKLPATQYGGFGQFQGANPDRMKDPSLRYDDPVYGDITPGTNLRPLPNDWVDIVGPALVLGSAALGGGLLSGGTGLESLFGDHPIPQGISDIQHLIDKPSIETLVSGIGGSSGEAAGAGSGWYLDGLLDAGLPSGLSAGTTTPWITTEGLLSPVVPFAPGAVTAAPGAASMFGPTLADAGTAGGLLGTVKEVIGKLGDASGLLAKSGLLDEGAGGGGGTGGGGAGGRGFGGAAAPIPGAPTEADMIAEMARRRGLARFLMGANDA